MKSYEVIFNDNKINEVPGVLLPLYNANNYPDRNVNIHKLARRSLSIVTSAEYSQKTISINLQICSGTRFDTESTITVVKSLLQAENGLLTLRQGNIEVFYTATMNEFNIEWVGATAYCEVIMIASTPIGTSTDSAVIATMNTTDSTSAITFTVSGSATAEPQISVTFNTVSGGTGKSVSVFNAITNQGITIDGDFQTGDVLEIDSMEMVATLNGSNKDFTGTFPTFPPGGQQLVYSDTFTSRNVDVVINANQRII